MDKTNQSEQTKTKHNVNFEIWGAGVLVNMLCGWVFEYFVHLLSGPLFFVQLLLFELKLLSRLLLPTYA